MSSIANLSSRLEQLLGSDRVRASEDALQEFAIAGRDRKSVV